jgi:hypothetical protein
MANGKFFFEQISAARIRIRNYSFWIRLRIRIHNTAWTCLLYSSLYVSVGVGTSHGRICSSAACAMPGGVWPTAACAAPQLFVYKSLSDTWTGLSTKAFLCTWCVCLQEEPMLNLCVSVYKSFFVHLVCLSTRRAYVELMCVCLQKLFCAPGVSVYKSLCGTSVADLDPGSGAFLTPGSGMCIKSGSGSGIRDEQPGSYFLELRNHFLG